MVLSTERRMGKEGILAIGVGMERKRKSDYSWKFVLLNQMNGEGLSLYTFVLDC